MQNDREIITKPLPPACFAACRLAACLPLGAALYRFACHAAVCAALPVFTPVCRFAACRIPVALPAVFMACRLALNPCACRAACTLPGVLTAHNGP